jgi:hypothetical protein
VRVKPDKKLVDLAVKRFGITDDFFEAGWILFDGRLLDLSGRHRDSHYEYKGDRFVPWPGEPDTEAGTRSVSHEESAKTMGMSIWTFASRLRAIRVLGCNGVEMFGMPSDAQIARIAQALRKECASRWANMGWEVFFIDWFERIPNKSGVYRSIGHAQMKSRAPGSTKGLTLRKIDGWMRKRISITKKEFDIAYDDPCICLEGNEHCCPKYRGRRG